MQYLIFTGISLLTMVSVLLNVPFISILIGLLMSGYIYIHKDNSPRTIFIFVVITTIHVVHMIFNLVNGGFSVVDHKQVVERTIAFLFQFGCIYITSHTVLTNRPIIKLCQLVKQIEKTTDVQNLKVVNDDPISVKFTDTVTLEFKLSLLGLEMVSEAVIRFGTLNFKIDTQKTDGELFFNKLIAGEIKWASAEEFSSQENLKLITDKIKLQALANAKVIIQEGDDYYLAWGN